MIPPNPSTAQEAISLLSEALKGLPVLAVMWYMLRDVRTTLERLGSKVSNMELQMASDRNSVKVSHLEGAVSELKTDVKDMRDEVQDLRTDMLKI